MWGLHVGNQPGAATAKVAQSAEQAAGQPLGELGAVTAEHPVISHTHGAMTAWRAKLRELSVTGGGQALSAGPLDEALIYGQAGEPVIRVTAAGITGQANKRDFTVQGPVHAVAERGAIITAARVQWDDAQQRLHCIGPVTARFRNAMVTAPEADYLVDSDTVEVPGDVRMAVGSNLVVGQRLTYNMVTQSFNLQSVRMVLHAKQARQALQQLRQ